MKSTQKTSQRPIRDKEAITRSQWEFRQKTRRLPEARENVNGLSAKKTTATTKPVLSSATDDIQQTPVTPNTFSCPKYCERRIPCEKCHFPKHLTCEVKGRVSLNTLWVLRMMSCARWVTFPALWLCCHGDAESCARSLSISVPRSLMMVITGAAFWLSRERKMAFRRYSVCWLCNSSRLFSWISKLLNYAISFLKKKKKEKRKAINLWILDTKMEKVMRAHYHCYRFSAGFSLSAGK